MLELAARLRGLPRASSRRRCEPREFDAVRRARPLRPRRGAPRPRLRRPRLEPARPAPPRGARRRLVASPTSAATPRSTRCAAELVRLGRIRRARRMPRRRLLERARHRSLLVVRDGERVHVPTAVHGAARHATSPRDIPTARGARRARPAGARRRATTSTAACSSAAPPRPPTPPSRRPPSCSPSSAASPPASSRRAGSRCPTRSGSPSRAASPLEALPAPLPPRRRGRTRRARRRVLARVRPRRRVDAAERGRPLAPARRVLARPHPGRRCANSSRAAARRSPRLDLRDDVRWFYPAGGRWIDEGLDRLVGDAEALGLAVAGEPVEAGRLVLAGDIDRGRARRSPRHFPHAGRQGLPAARPLDRVARSARARARRAAPRLRRRRGPRPRLDATASARHP